MKKIIFLFITALVLTSCGTSRNSVVTTKKEEAKNTRTTPNFENEKMKSVIKAALSFEGTPYKFGGTTSSGMDCSGLIYTCYLKEDVKLPRTSRDMAKYGKEVKAKEIAVGDLLFFQTDKTSRKINHVGLVVEKKSNNIFFIHSTTSRGVIISSLDESYWNNSFVMVRRMI